MIFDFINAIVRMSVEGIVIILTILGIRALFKAIHISNKFIVPLWIIAFFYLVFPFKVPTEHGFWKQDVFTENTEEELLLETAENDAMQYMDTGMFFHYPYGLESTKAFFDRVDYYKDFC